MTELRSTPVPSIRAEASQRLKRRRHPLDLFADQALAARLWCVVALIAGGYCVVQPFLLLRAWRTREKVVVLDSAGSYHVSPLLAFEEAGKLHEQHAVLACLALLQRNPAGFDHLELLEKLFLSEALAQAKAEQKRSAEEFAQKNLHQKAEVLKLTVLETQDESVLVQAEGQLVRTGTLGGQTFTEAPAFTARFTFARNPNLAGNGRFPLAVWRYDVSW